MMAFQCRQAPVRIIHVGSVVAHNALRSERLKVLTEGQFSDMWGILQHIRRKNELYEFYGRHILSVFTGREHGRHFGHR